MTNISVILVSGGNPDYTSVELLHTNGTRLCSLPNLPSTRTRHTQTGLTACGSWDSPARTTCHTLSSTGSWEESHSLDKNRREHCAWRAPQGVMLLGGWDSSSGTTSEILLENGDTSPSFNLNYQTR